MSTLNPDEIAQAIKAGQMAIISCARAPESLDGTLLGTGYERGYWCGLCGAEVQVSPRGRAQLAAGGVVTCNACGIGLAERASKQNRLSALHLSPEVEAALQRGRTTIDPQRIENLTGRTFPPRAAPPMSCDSCGAQPGGLWFYPHTGFHLAAVGGETQVISFAEGDWAACDDCAKLFERECLDTLVDKALKDRGDVPRRRVEVLYAGLLACRKGPPRWVTGPMDPRRRHA